MDTNFKRNLLISFSTSLAILLISSTASFVSIRNLVDSNRLVNSTQEVIYHINEASALMVDAQTSMRGFLITGREDFLRQYTNSEDLVDAHFDKLEKLIENDPAQQRNIAAINPLKDRFFSYLARRVNEKKRNVPILAEELESGRRLMDDMRRIFRRMESDQQLILAERSAESEKFGFYSSLLIVIAAIIATFMSVLFFLRILSDFSKRTKLQRALEIKDVETAERIRVISGIAEQIAKGDYEIRAVQGEADALGSVGDSLNNMASALGVSFKTLSEKEWLQAGIAQLNQVMISEKTVVELAKDVVEYLAVYTGSNAGVLYLPDGEELVATAGYSFVPSVNRQRIKIGEGLTGQAFASGEIMELKAASEDDIKISYALGEIKPAHIIALPLIEDKIAGVVELARIQEFTARETDFFKAVSSNIAIAMTAALNRKRVQELLEETEAQSNELKTQHSELEMMNAELETQTEKLQASEEELRVQQEELQQTNEELAERSVLLEEKNLEIQKKSEDLELTTRYKSEFLANMSHELRTPLNSILLLSRLLSENNDSNLSEEQIEFAKVIQSSGNGLLGLIDEILDLSKIEAGKMELELLDVPTSEIAESLQSLFHEVARQKNITFEIISDNAPMVLKTDRMRLEQILKNLISNAIKFTSVGSVTLEIKYHPANSNTICFIVTDTGIGIPSDQQPLIFEAFRQADGSTKRKFGGTGLGLSISRELAKLLKGEITLQSAENQGSEFTLCIPIATSHMAKSYQPVVETIVEKPKSTEIHDSYLSTYIPDAIADDRDAIANTDKIILIVEDDVNFAKSLLEFTRQRGYKGIVCVRGDHALELALQYKPIGILLDIQLPVKSGLDVIEELKGNSQTRPIPVHMMSSHKMKRESLLRGAVNFLDKPIAFEQMPEVFKKIEYIVNRKAQKVLIIEDNLQHAKALEYFLESSEINSEVQSDIDQGIAALQKEDVDCVILDMGIPDNKAYSILENVKKNPGLENLPIIVFTGKSLSLNEETKIKKYADSIVVKTAHSYQRMLDEVSLFMHLVEENKRSDNANVGKKKNPLQDILNGKTVLVVDDDVRNIYSLTKALEALQMNVITAIDGREALAVLGENPKTDVVLLDMMMPNMDGYETAKRIREIKKHKNLPVIAVTAKAMTGDREKCINAGASDYITKPVDIDQLMSLLRVWLYDRL